MLRHFSSSSSSALGRVTSTSSASVSSTTPAFLRSTSISTLTTSSTAAPVFGSQARHFLTTSTPNFAPKKKAKGKGDADGGGAGSAAPKDPGAYHLYNIFAERQDPVVEKDDGKYPSWLYQMEKAPPGYGELSLIFIYGTRIEEANLYLYMRFLKLHRKLQIKMNNLKLKKGKRRLQLKW